METKGEIKALYRDFKINLETARDYKVNLISSDIVLKLMVAVQPARYGN